MRTKNKLLAATLLMAAGAILPALSWVRAQDVASEKQISLALALETAAAAIERCRKDGYRVAVTVVDRAGQVKATLRDDGAGPHTADTSRRKAYTALTFRAVTSEVAKCIAANPEAAGLKEVTDVLILGRGIPIRAGKEIIGAVGVSGALGAGLFITRLHKRAFWICPLLDASETRASLLAAISYVPQKVCSTRSCAAGGASYRAKAG